MEPTAHLIKVGKNEFVLNPKVKMQEVSQEKRALRHAKRSNFFDRAMQVDELRQLALARKSYLKMRNDQKKKIGSSGIVIDKTPTIHDIDIDAFIEKGRRKANELYELRKRRL